VLPQLALAAVERATFLGVRTGSRLSLLAWRRCSAGELREVEDDGSRRAAERRWQSNSCARRNLSPSSAVRASDRAGARSGPVVAYGGRAPRLPTQAFDSEHQGSVRFPLSQSCQHLICGSILLPRHSRGAPEPRLSNGLSVQTRDEMKCAQVDRRSEECQAVCILLFE
jgi:hypothetical protein